MLVADSLCKKLSRAKLGMADTGPAFEDLSERLEPALIQEWTAQESVAMEERGENLRIYNVKSTEGM